MDPKILVNTDNDPFIVATGDVAWIHEVDVVASMEQVCEPLTGIFSANRGMVVCDESIGESCGDYDTIDFSNEVGHWNLLVWVTYMILCHVVSRKSRCVTVSVRSHA